MLSIAALKKVSKGTRILLLDRNGGQAKSIAKALSKKGFKKVRPAISSGSLQKANGFLLTQRWDSLMPVRLSSHGNRLAAGFSLSQIEDCKTDVSTMSDVCRSSW